MDSKNASNQNPKLIKSTLIRRFLIFSFAVVLILALTPFFLLWYLHLQDDETVVQITAIESFIAKKIDKQLNAVKLNISSFGLTKGQGLLTPKIVFLNVDITETNGVRILSVPKILVDLDVFTGIPISNNSGRVRKANRSRNGNRNRNGKIVVKRSKNRNLSSENS